MQYRGRRLRQIRCVIALRMISQHLQHPFGESSEEEAAENLFGRLVEQQILMPIDISRQRVAEDHSDQSKRLVVMPRPLRRRGQIVDRFLKPLADDQPRRRTGQRFTGGRVGIQTIPSGKRRGVRRAAGKVEITDDLMQRVAERHRGRRSGHRRR